MRKTKKTIPSLLEEIEKLLTHSAQYKYTYHCASEPAVSNVKVIWENGEFDDMGAWGSHDWVPVTHKLKYRLEDKKLSDFIPKKFNKTFDLQSSLYIMNQNEIEHLANNSDILARDPSDKYNILHWLIESFIPTQLQGLSAVIHHPSQHTRYLNITYNEGNGKFSHDIVDTQEKAFKGGVRLKTGSIDIKDGTDFISIVKIIRNPRELYDTISSQLDKKDIGNLFMTQDTHGNTPLHLLLTQSGKTDKMTAYDELLNYLLNKVVPKLSAKVKVKLLCTQNNDGNNILHMLEDCHGEQLWLTIYDAFGMNAFVRAKIQLNNNHDIPAASSSTCPIELARLSPNSEPDEEPAEESDMVDDEEKSTLMPDNHTEEKKFTMAPVSDKKINSNQKSRQQELIQIKNLLNRKEIFPIEAFLESELSANDLLLEYRDGSTIFGTIIANKSFGLISHCIKNLLSPWELHDFYQRNSQEVKASIGHNPNISLPEWKNIYDSQTIVIQLFDYLSHRRLKKNKVKLLVNRGEDLDFITRQNAWLGLLETLYNREFLLPEPSFDLRGGIISSDYYELHLRLYNLAQAMTVDEREDTFWGCFSTYGDEFVERDPYLTAEILQRLGLNAEDYLTILEPNQSSPYDPHKVLRSDSNQQPTPSAPSSYLNDEEDSNNEELERIPVATATLMTSSDDRRNLPVGTIFSPHKEGEEEKTTDHEKSDCTIS